MKQFKRLIALLLCLAMTVCLFACDNTTPEDTTPSETEPPVTDPPAPKADELYASAREALDSATDITLALTAATYTTVNDDEFSQLSTQTLTYRNLGTENLLIFMDEEMDFSIHSEDYDPEESETASYSEIYSQGTVYAQLQDTYRFSGTVAAEDASARYYPVVLLDAALYGNITAEESETGTVIRFSEPTAAESWAIPEDAELLEASGTALLSTDGTLTQMDYSVTYTYGPAEITLEIQSCPQAAQEVTVPDNPYDYPALQYIDALRTAFTAGTMLAQADSATTASMESLFCQAAGVLRNQSTVVNLHGRKDETSAKIEQNIYFMDYSTNQSEEYEQEEVFRNGKYTYTVNDGLPTSSSAVSWEDIREYTAQAMLSHILSMDHWEDAEVTDLGSVYLIEYTLNENFGNTIQNSICDMLWEDPSFLINLSSAYETNVVNGYLSVDKYTGLSVSGGYYYEGTHTIQGTDYLLTFQYDQSVEAPAKGAYHEITDEMLPEAEPENKPTPLFYHVTGENGQEMWLLGTIHVGDERTAYLPQEIKDAFAASDALALECDSEAFDEQVEEDDALSEEVSNLYFYSNGITIESLIEEFIAKYSDEEAESEEPGDAEEEEDAYAQAVKLLKAVGGYNMNMPYAKPYVWSNTIENFYLRQGYQLHSDQGVEERLHDWAEELDKEIREVESSLFQIKMLTGFSNDLQLLMLDDAMYGTAQEYWEGVWDLYEKWCAGDEAVLREELSDEVDMTDWTEEEIADYEKVKHLLDEYNKAMSFDRNEGMLNKAIEYLESGDVVFYAVGLAHLLDGTNGLVDALREAGYTVELVRYNG